MRRLSWPWVHNMGKYSRRCAWAKRQKSLSLRKRGHWERMARVRTSDSHSRAGRPRLLRRGGGWCSRHQLSTSTYNETKKESRSIMGHHLWAKVWYQHKGSAPSPSSGITHQPAQKIALTSSDTRFTSTGVTWRSRNKTRGGRLSWLVLGFRT